MFKISETNNSKLNPLIEAIQSLNKDRSDLIQLLINLIKKYFKIKFKKDM